MYRKTKHIGQSTKLNAWFQRALICHIERFLHDTSSKSGHTLFQETIQSYSKTAGYLQFKAHKKPLLTQKHKKVRLRWARKHVD